LAKFSPSSIPFNAHGGAGVSPAGFLCVPSACKAAGGTPAPQKIAPH